VSRSAGSELYASELRRQLLFEINFNKQSLKIASLSTPSNRLQNKAFPLAACLVQGGRILQS